MADISTGLYSALSILALLYSRDAGSDSGGHGNAVAVSLFDTMTDLMGYPLTYTQHSGVDQQPLGMSSPAVAPYGAYRTADGQTVVLGTTNDAEWQRLSRQILQRDDLADDPRFASNSGRCAHRDILDEAIGAWCAAHDLEHVQKTADAAGIGNARYNLPSEVLVHPQLTARDRWRQVDTPAGPIPALLPPPVISGYQPAMGAVPGLGQHTDAVLAELGIAADEIVALRAPRRHRTGLPLMSEESVLLCSDRNGVRTLTLNRPQRKNAINRELWIALAEALTAAGNDRGVRAVVITGAGGAFCSGADIATSRRQSPGAQAAAADRRGAGAA